MRVLLSVLVFVAASPAWALVTLSMQSASQSSVSINAGNCGGELTVNFQVTPISTQLCDQFEVWATSSSSCRDEPGESDFIIGTQNITLQPTGTFTFRVSDLPSFDTNACGTAGIETTARICGAYSYLAQLGVSNCDSAPVDRAATPLLIEYDSKPPPVPVITSVTPKDSGLSLSVTSTDSVLIRPQFRPASSTGEFVGRPGVSSTGPIEISELQNGTQYEVRVIAEDSAGNVSEPSAPQLGMPVQTIGFFGSYCRAGGDCEGGCGAAAGGPTLLGLLAAVFALSRRKS